MVKMSSMLVGALATWIGVLCLVLKLTIVAMPQGYVFAEFVLTSLIVSVADCRLWVGLGLMITR